MSRRSSDDQVLQAIHAAEMYYFEGMTQSAIADRLSLSRWTVGRILDDARESGLVRITIDHPLARHHQLEVQLVKQFELAGAVVVPTQTSTPATIDAVCAAAADRLASVRPSPAVVGVSWGRSTALVAKHLHVGWARGVTIAQTNGGVAVTRNDLVGRSIVTMAERGPGRALTLQAPTIVGRRELGDLLRADASVSRTMEVAARADLMVFAPGPVEKDSVLVAAGHIPVERMTALAEAGAGADVMSHFVDDAGDVVDPDLEARTISIDLASVRHCRRVIAVAPGVNRARAVRTVAAAGLCTDLVTDSETAARALEL